VRYELDLVLSGRVVVVGYGDPVRLRWCCESEERDDEG
jgi:hypothetical protein